MKLLEFTIPGRPQAWQRAGRNNRTGVTFTPKETARYENLVKHMAAQAMGPHPPLEGPLRLEVLIDLEPPRSWSEKRKREAVSGEIRATKKPDLSNLAKGIEDAMNGIVYRDDSQIVELVVTKDYADKPQVTVTVLNAGGRAAP